MQPVDMLDLPTTTASHATLAGGAEQPEGAVPRLAAGDRRHGLEAWANAAFACSALAAAVMRLVTAAPGERGLPAVLGIAAINGLIAVLFLIRRPVVSIGSAGQLASCLPTMIGFGLAVRLAPELADWPWYAHALFGGGALVTLAAFVWLGGSFAVLPALRRVVSGGPYRFVRHPAYAGELVMAAACFAAGPSLPALIPWLLLAPGVVWRILSEEAVLRRDEAYRHFGQQVRWRLIPGLW